VEQLLVIKIGGNIIDDAAALHAFIEDFATIPIRKILVHGGGKLATELSTKLGVQTRMVDGRRITDEDTIRIVTMTYAGWINKSITAKLQSVGCNAIGLCGADGMIIPAVKRPVEEIDYGWVGDIEADKVNAKFLSQLLDSSFTPVIAPVTSDKEGNLLNVNADTIGQVLAQALSKFYNTTLVYCFERNGLLLDVNDPSSVIGEINYKTAQELKQRKIIADGMIPKIDNAFNALQSGVQSVVIGHAKYIKKIASGEKNYGTYLKT
jgi:acetylglutamate kinase